MSSILLVVFSGVISYLLTFLTRNIALRHRIIDIPNERSLHEVPTPRVGGVAIVISWYLGISVLFWLNAIESKLYFALLSGILLAIVSLVDDVIEIKPAVRLFIHFITATGAFIFLGNLRPLIIPSIEINYPLLIYPFAIVGMVWFINLFNFMDGVDGFASIEAIVISIILFYFSGNIINVLLIACVGGFLFWNWPKAKIFMGDIGSTQLGFILIVLGIYFHNSYKFSILNWIMLSSPFWFDATFTLYRRWRNREKLSQAHRKHAYQRIVLAGFSHLKVDIYLIVINLIIIAMIFTYREFKILQIPLYILSILFLYIITKYVDRRVPFK
ncbi:MAG: glycosyltransferase family 4 protein [Bacteroidales bacterium]|nr:MAG: glycosyltransferase family 4 protein [Bacteroidales bacterium]